MLGCGSLARHAPSSGLQNRNFQLPVRDAHDALRQDGAGVLVRLPIKPADASLPNS
jgi:hypothetical protein